MAVQRGDDVAGTRWQGDVSKAQAGRGELAATWQVTWLSCHARGGRFWVCVGPPFVRERYLSGVARCNEQSTAIPVYNRETVVHRVLLHCYVRALDMHEGRQI